jgi:hypothetical protein
MCGYVACGPDCRGSDGTTTIRHTGTGYLLRGKGGRCLGLTTLQHSCADCVEILGTSTSWNPKGLSRAVQGLLDSKCLVKVMNLWYSLVGRYQHSGWYVSHVQTYMVDCHNILQSPIQYVQLHIISNCDFPYN